MFHTFYTPLPHAAVPCIRVFVCVLQCAIARLHGWMGLLVGSLIISEGERGKERGREMETEEGKRERRRDDSPCKSAPITRFLDKAGEEEGREMMELERGQWEVRKSMKQNERGGGGKDESENKGREKIRGKYRWMSDLLWRGWRGTMDGQA